MPITAAVSRPPMTTRNWTIYCVECVASIVIFTCAIMIPLCRNPLWWIHDYPPDIREKHFETHEHIGYAKDEVINKKHAR